MVLTFYLIYTNDPNVIKSHCYVDLTSIEFNRAFDVASELFVLVLASKAFISCIHH